MITNNIFDYKLKDIGLTFDKENHVHKIDGIMVPGCTTVTGILPKDFMGGWVAKITHDTAIAEFQRVWNKYQTINMNDVQDVMKLAKSAWRVKRDTSAEKGTLAHSWIETYIKTGERPPFPKDKEILNSIELFLDWELDNEIEWLVSELQVGSVEHMYAGILDFICNFNGVFTLGDFKTGSGIYPEQYIQLAGLGMAWEEQGGRIPQQRLILNIPKTGETFNSKIVPTNYEHDKEMFLIALNLYRHLERIKNVHKESNGKH